MAITLTKEAKKTLTDAGFWFWGICKIFSVIWLLWVISFMKNLPTSFLGLIIELGLIVAIVTIIFSDTF